MLAMEKPDFLSGVKTAVALGFFDGVHIGHKKVLQFASEKKKDDFCPIALTFNQRPASLVDGAALIADAAETRKEIERLGCRVVILDFESVRNLSPREFVEEILCGKLNAGFVSCGYNYHFGKDAKGDANFLLSLCKDFGLEAKVADCVKIDNQPVSSTAIRAALKEGDVKLAWRMLGRPYSYQYTVVEGDKRGRLLNSPTANQFFPQEVLVPRYGVYAAMAEVQGKKYPAVTNIGIRPTIGHSLPRSETYIIGFDGDLYGRQIRVSLLKYMRGEIPFPDLASLRAQILSDAERARSDVGKMLENGEI